MLPCQFCGARLDLLMMIRFGARFSENATATRVVIVTCTAVILAAAPVFDWCDVPQTRSFDGALSLATIEQVPNSPWTKQVSGAYEESTEEDAEDEILRDVVHDTTLTIDQPHSLTHHVIDLLDSLSDLQAAPARSPVLR